MSQRPPEIRSNDPPTICSAPMKPRAMTGDIVQLLRQKFAAGNFEEAGLYYKPPAWKPDPIQSGIAIEKATRWGTNDNARPALLVRRDGWEIQKLGIDDRLIAGGNARGGIDYSVPIVGSHTVFVISDDDDDVEDLAAETYRFFMMYRSYIRETFQLLKFAVAGVPAPGRLRESGDSYAIPITLAYAFTDDWRITQQAPVLGNVIVDPRVSS